MNLVYHEDMSEQHMGVRELREHLGKRVDAAHFLREPTVIEKNGEPRAVLISYADWTAICQPQEGTDEAAPQNSAP